ncbi:5-hydroxytryptamine receptor 3A-like [Boleophthalmus pectinirostris]|uniref:5-hydroxytryptamine receptor 3A-like n=1 Tax=Boleophthalmus pectinirostris TaxID=150288 RepID=UPI00242DCA58|nr:5-hydroxytryptamine receptor 3A-like [Boleophthalmus pectinirostris]
MLIKKELKSQPQYENCSVIIEIPLLEYQTLAVDTKNLRLVSRLQAILQWRDPEMSWNTSLYQYEEVSVPVDSVWTPELHVTNAITITTQPSSKDLEVLSDGRMRHEIILNTEVNCEVNLFNYPFAADACPVAIHIWNSKKCGGEMRLDEVKMKDGAHGDWQTEDVHLDQKGGNKKFILVELRIRQNNPFITLMLPSILIIMADVVSVALPLEGGERNSFKVTLVLSFTMFLIILNGELPGDSQCSPVIRIHFCVCLITLVFSMLVSMVLTRVAKEGGIIFCCFSKRFQKENAGMKDEGKNNTLYLYSTLPKQKNCCTYNIKLEI